MECQIMARCKKKKKEFRMNFLKWENILLAWNSNEKQKGLIFPA